MTRPTTHTTKRPLSPAQELHVLRKAVAADNASPEQRRRLEVLEAHERELWANSLTGGILRPNLTWECPSC